VDRIRELVEEAQDGDAASFGKLVALNQGRVLGYARNRLGSPAEAEDAVQETFIRAFTRLSTLGNPACFGSWLFAICRSTVSSALRKARRGRTVPLEREPEAPAQATAAEWHCYGECLRLAVSTLPDRDREILELRYYSELSYRAIASLIHASPALVKSRLHEARLRLKKVLPTLHQGIELSPEKYTHIKERIMRQLELMKNAALAIRKMSLKRQVELCQSAQKGEKLPPSVLSDMGETEEGKRTLTGYQGRITLQELISVLGMSRDLENWVVENLDREAPEIAEAIKRHSVVFEDIVLAEKQVVERLVADMGEEVLVSLSNCPVRVKSHVLAVLTEAQRSDWAGRWQELDTTTPRIHEAQALIVDRIRHLMDEGLIEVLGPDSPDPQAGRPIVRMRKRA
jgi:RNA polymerase sigma-70 factor (ECF subfamily)